jgi:hypothetical protein
MLVEPGTCNLPLKIMEGSDGMITRDAICRLEETTTTAVDERNFANETASSMLSKSSCVGGGSMLAVDVYTAWRSLELRKDMTGSAVAVG